ncbi:MAG: CsbD family protein [Candidatus Electronema sp. VV]
MNEHSSVKDRIEGKLHQMNGKIKENAGRLVGNQELEAEGRRENLSGKIQDKIGQVEKVLGM